MTNVKYGCIFNHYELLLAYIVEVRLSERRKECNQYLFASADKINSFGVTFGSNDLVDKIASHTPKILTENADHLTRRNKYKKIVTVKP